MKVEKDHSLSKEEKAKQIKKISKAQEELNKEWKNNRRKVWKMKLRNKR